MDIKKGEDPIEIVEHSALHFEGLHMISLTGPQDLFPDILLLVVEDNGEPCLYVNF